MTTQFAVDLHCHTTASDGLHSPTEIVKMAKDMGMIGIGITDHDTIAGWEEAVEAGQRFGVNVVRGVELNSDLGGAEVHILGYEFNPLDSEFSGKLSQIRGARHNRIMKIVRKLASLGMEISLEEVERIATGESIGRPHIAQVLVDKGYACSIKDAFNKYIGKNAPAFIDRYKLSPEEAVALIRKAGGVAVLAHPAGYNIDYKIKEWIDIGLNGIEISHPDHTAEDERKYNNLAEVYNLLPTGGSDFHGEGRKPGITIGKWGTSVEIMGKIIQAGFNMNRHYQKGAR